MKEHEYYNLHHAANRGNPELEKRVEALEKAIEVLANRLPTTSYMLVKRQLKELGINVKRSDL